MFSFNDVENAIASFSDKFNNKELNLILKFFKNVDFDFFKSINNIDNFIDDFIINKIIIINCKDFKKSGFSANSILCKHNNLFLIDISL